MTTRLFLACLLALFGARGAFASGPEGLHRERSRLRLAARKAQHQRDPERRRRRLGALREEYSELLKRVEKRYRAACKAAEPVDNLDSFTIKYRAPNLAVLRKRSALELLRARLLFESAKAHPRGSKEEAEVLGRAHAALDLFALDCSDGVCFDLLPDASLLMTEAALRLGRYDEASEEAEGLALYTAPLRFEKPEPRREVEALEDRVKTSAYRLLMGARSLGGEHASALAAFEDLKRELPSYAETREGVEARFERARCLARFGRTAEAAAALLSMIHDPLPPSVFALTRSELRTEAMRVLDEVAAIGGEGGLSPEALYRAGCGAASLGDHEGAALRFKAACRAARGSGLWGVLAGEALGAQLKEDGRFLEAALAGQMLCESAPGSSRIGRVRSSALNCLEAARRRFGAEALRPLETAIKPRFLCGGSGLAGAQVLMREATKLQERRLYLLAAELYREVPPAPVELHANALANAGLCLFEAYEKSGDRELLIEADSVLDRAERRGGEAVDQLVACYRARIYNRVGKPGWALDVLGRFDQPSGSILRFEIMAREEQLRAFLARGQLGEAERRWAALREYKDRRVTGMLLSLAEACREAGAAAPSASEARRLRIKAGRYALDWYRRSAALGRDRLVWVAELAAGGGLLKEMEALAAKRGHGFSADSDRRLALARARAALKAGDSAQAASLCERLRR